MRQNRAGQSRAGQGWARQGRERQSSWQAQVSLTAKTHQLGQIDDSKALLLFFAFHCLSLLQGKSLAVRRNRRL